MLGLRRPPPGIVYPNPAGHAGARHRHRPAPGCQKEGLNPSLRSFDPARVRGGELEKLRKVAEDTIAEVAAEQGRSSLDIPVGNTMIELLRAAVTADEIGAVADFFKLRHERPDPDDVRLQPRRRGGRVRPAVPGRAPAALHNPFATIDPGVAEARGRWASSWATRATPTSSAALLRRARRRSHSVKTFHTIGLDLRQLLPVPRAAGPSGRRSGRPLWPKTMGDGRDK